MSDTRILLQVVHPDLPGSTGNRALVDAVGDLPGLTVNDLYSQYPDWDIDIAREQDLLRAHDVVVFQHPLYWGSSPALLKQWQDTVLQYGFCFPPGKGTALEGKKWLQAITVGGPQTAYDGKGKRFTIEQLLRPFQSTANYCSMDWQKPFAVYGISSSEKMKPGALEEAGRLFRDRLTSF